MKLKQALTWLHEPAEITPLAGFRVLFGAAMVLSTLRFLFLGWVHDHYIEPIFHFSYYGFAWVKAGPEWMMYGVHALLLLSSVAVMLGYYYRIAAVIQFLAFTYTELIDLTYYLNHYYYVSLVCFLLIFLPANRFFSLDVHYSRIKPTRFVPRWQVVSLMLMIGIVYFYAGVAKINSDWLLKALPLKIWLPASSNLPVLGSLFAWKWAPWLFSWAGMLYDCSIVFLLINGRTRPWAYLSVILFHTLTGILFQIGVFPLVMMAGTLIFFSPDWHLRWMRFFDKRLQYSEKASFSEEYRKPKLGLGFSIIALFFAFQLVFPLRFLMYPGKLGWTEEGYRFSWRVMLMEKAGTAQFYVQEQGSMKKGIVVNSEFLNSHQEKQMSYQPDMLLQYAHFLHDYYTKQGLNNPAITAEVYVTLNGRPSSLFIDSTLNLAAIEDNWSAKTWIKPYPWKD